MKRGQVIIYLVVLLLPICSYAMEFDPPWVNLDSFTMDFSIYDSQLETVSGIDTIGYAGWGYVAFDDTDSSNSISQGDKFMDYVVLNVTGFYDAGLNSITLSKTLDVNWQISLEAILTGHVTSVDAEENFVFDELVKAYLYVDSTTDDNGLSKGQFTSDPNDLSNFFDGGKLLEGVKLVNGSSDGNKGYLGLSNSQGKYQVAIQIKEGEDGGGFLKNNSGENLFDIWEALALFPDGDLTKMNSSEVSVAFQKYYGLPKGPFDFAYTFSTTHGSMDLGAVPEPATFLLFGTGILSLGGFFRKNKSKK